MTESVTLGYLLDKGWDVAVSGPKYPDLILDKHLTNPFAVEWPGGLILLLF